MTRRPALIAAALLLTACASSTRITDFSDRSVGYGWLDIKDVDVNRLQSVYIHQYRPRSAEPYHTSGLIEFKGGYLYYAQTLPVGAHKLDTAIGLRCLGILCGGTEYRYAFGKQGDDTGAVVINAPGVYHFGSYRLSEVKTAWLEPRRFDVAPAANAPSRREMLEEILKHVDEPAIAARIRSELARTR